MWKKAEKRLLKDKYLGGVVKKWGGCTIIPIKKAAYFEDLVNAICSQQLSGKAAQTIFNRVKNILNGKIVPDVVLAASDQELRDCGLSWSKVRYIKDLSVKVGNSTLKLENLNNLSDEEVVQELTKVAGIGRWTAEMFLMFSLARPDVFPLDDLGIRKGMNKLFNKDLTSIEMMEKSNLWRPYKTVASWYIWRSLDN